MERKILETIAAMPGCRQRSIAKSIGVWQCDGLFLNTLHALEEWGLIRRENFSDPAQMEFFYKWYLTNAGERAIMNVENKERGFVNG